MSKIPIRQCPKCELYSDISVLKCKCGENLEAIDAKLVETDDLKDEEKGEINEGSAWSRPTRPRSTDSARR